MMTTRFLTIDRNPTPFIHLLEIRTLPADQQTYPGEEEFGHVACNADLGPDWAATNDEDTAWHLFNRPELICPSCLARYRETC